MESPELTPLLTDEPKLPVYVTKIGENSWGQGAHTDPVLAQLKAAGEALERHCLLTPSDDASVQARYGELEGQVDPADFYCYSPAQTEDYESVLEELRRERFYWTQVQDVVTGRSALIPREFVYLDAASREPRGIRREAISSGAAIGIAETQGAFGRALFELIERDAFMAVWLRGESPARIGNLTGATARLLTLLDRYSLDCRLFDIRSVGVPAVFAVTLDSSGIGPAVTTGLSAAENYEDAVTAAILESLSYRRQVRLKQMAGEFPEVHNASEITSVETRIAFWSQTARLDELPHWIRQAPAVSLRELDSVSCTPKQALETLTQQGCRVFAAPIATPAAKAQGFEAVRVVVPELHPLFLSEAAMALQSGHLGPIVPRQGTLPHPFA